MKVLGIETSCDETACAIVEDGTRILANKLYSQVDLHAETGGVVPEVAAREHVVKILPVIDQVLRESVNGNWDEIDAIAVTQAPGLVSSLIIGTTVASAISLLKNKPIIPVNHIRAHVYANWLERDDDEPAFPVLVLTVSGGHNELILMRDHGDFEIIGETLDDAAGEAFDKVARLLGLGYPGGPAISKAALKGDATKFDLPRAYLGKGSFDFSFSGLKTAVLNLVKAQGKLTPEFVNDCAASFQEAVCDVLVDRILTGISKFGPTEVHLAGGVSANRRLREVLEEKIGNRVTLRWPAKIEFCTDNAAMVASAGYFMLQKGKFEVENVVPKS